MYSYIDIGERNNDVLVLVHGLGSRKESWKYQFELSKNFRVIAPDLRGHGDSSFDDDITIKTFARDIIHLLEQLDISAAHFCGLSLGGIVIQEIVKTKPAIVQSLILSNTSSYIPRMTGLYALSEGKKNLAKMSDDLYEQHMIKQCMYDAKNEKLFHDIHSFYFKLNRKTYLKAAKSGVGINYLSTLMFCPKPIIIIASLNDRITPYLNATTMSLAAPFSKMHTFDQCGHTPNVECPAEYNRVLLNFLNEHRSNKAASQ
ncbi:beta-ketoadipate enol-lactone hydrolase [Geomicrobium sp. JCM 19037]|uniref:alpha/beta fold hydrolase n=1 Tax=unclassified Geomicrobium TaxID=2628951 RepID=UPI00045F3044|nr:alpha/beta hydrolase [Geomicrobium sp. JCM 19037]GAK05462.1 beta-ketoadipate enol-lactone hydrolase [Geomicrobium sp. JCM 19037]